MKRVLSGIGFPLATVAIAFLIAGLVVLLTGSNPLTIYKSLWVGAGLDWPFQFIPGNPFGVNGQLAEINLIATIVQATPLILTGPRGRASPSGPACSTSAARASSRRACSPRS